MFINLITPCSRPGNLLTIQNTINIPKQMYRWIVVIDGEAPVEPDKNLPDQAEIYYYTSDKSISGNGQRNFALDLIEKGHILFLDDDTVLHPQLWETVKGFEKYDFISYPQVWKNGALRLTGHEVKLGRIDSNNFMVDCKIVADLRWRLDVYEADGYFAEEAYKRAVNPKYFGDWPLSVYNYLR